MRRVPRALILSALALLSVSGLGGARAQTSASPAADTPTVTTDDPWPSLAAQIFDNHPLQDGRAVVAIDAPYRAEDAALVPITIRLLLPPDQLSRVRKVTLVIDENPSPLAAVFEFAPDSGIDRLSTRVRVNDYTNIHAVAETADGTLFVTQRFVKAAGGCSAPAATPVAGDVPLGTMRFRRFPPGSDPATTSPEAELMIRHPNYSGMQMDQVTRLYTPAHFVRSVTLWRNDRKLLSVEGGISLSENPAFRFDYRPDGASRFRAEVVDSKGLHFTAEWPVQHLGT